MVRWFNRGLSRRDWPKAPTGFEGVSFALGDGWAGIDADNSLTHLRGEWGAPTLTLSRRVDG
jgi:hypothetical protein